MEPLAFAALAAVCFAAATVQAATGFGFAILAVPFLLLIMGSLAAIQVTAVTNFALSLMLIPGLIADVPRRTVAHLAIGSAIGFPLGLAAFLAADLAAAKIAAGATITTFALWLTVREWRGAANGPAAGGGTHLQARLPSELGVGIVSGIMAGALAMPGPAVMLYLAARQTAKQITRAASLTLFGFSYGAVTFMHALWGGMTAATWLLALILVPVVLAGAAAGHVATRYLGEKSFRWAILTILLLSGLYAVWTAL